MSREHEVSDSNFFDFTEDGIDFGDEIDDLASEAAELFDDDKLEEFEKDGNFSEDILEGDIDFASIDFDDLDELSEAELAKLADSVFDTDTIDGIDPDECNFKFDEIDF